LLADTEAFGGSPKEIFVVLFSLVTDFLNRCLKLSQSLAM